MRGSESVSLKPPSRVEMRKPGSALVIVTPREDVPNAIEAHVLELKILKSAKELCDAL